jgi:hypothetical protein
MRRKNTTNCEYLIEDSCKTAVEIDEVKTVRQESCLNKSKDNCCYLCRRQKSFEIGCNYLDQPENYKPIEQELPVENSVEQEIDPEFTAQYLVDTQLSQRKAMCI